MDNLYYKLKGKLVNKIVFIKKNNVIIVFYIGNIGNRKSIGIILFLVDVFFENKIM